MTWPQDQTQNRRQTIFYCAFPSHLLDTDTVLLTLHTMFIYCNHLSNSVACNMIPPMSQIREHMSAIQTARSLYPSEIHRWLVRHSKIRCTVHLIHGRGQGDPGGNLTQNVALMQKDIHW